MDDARANLFGMLAVKVGLATREQVDECLRAQQEAWTSGGPIPLLGEAMEEKGYLSREQVDAILSGEFAVPGKRFGELCVRMRFCAAAAVQSALAEQKRLRSSGSSPRIGELLLRQSAIKPRHIPAVLSAQGFEIAECAKCRLSYNVVVDAPSSSLKCARCGRELLMVTGYEDIDGWEMGGDIVPSEAASAKAVVSEVLPPEELLAPPAPQPPGRGGAEGTAALRQALDGGTELVEGAAAAEPREEDPGMGQAIDVGQLSLEVLKEDGGDRDGAPAPATGKPEAEEAEPVDKGALEEAPEESPVEEEAPVYGEFRVIQKIGEDALGTLYRAEHVKTGRVVALKLIDPERTRDKAFMERFVAETKRASTLDHPNLKPVIAAGRHKGRLYYATEFVNGKSVRQIMRSGGAIPPAEAIRIAKEVAKGLSHAHARGIYHGDIKPSCIIVSPEGDVKLAECGVAKNVHGNLDRLIQRHGVTPFYVAPELAAPGGVADARGDVYELGASLFHMVTGRPPFEGQSPLQILMRMAEEEPPKAHEVSPDVPPGLSKVIRRMMSPRIRDRYQSVGEVVNDLGRLP